MGAFINKLLRVDARRLKKLQVEVEKVLAFEEEMAKLTDEELQAKTPYFKKLLEEGKTHNDIKYEAYAVAREADRRVLGEFPYRVQVMGALVLDNGDVAEMRTGEGKTLTATMAVYLNALEGKGVHVITVNEYLAKRDAEWMGRVYKFLGLTVGVNVRDLTPLQKKEQFLCDVTYSTSSEIGFDYLRDNMVEKYEDKVLRGLNFALVDEADSVLIDEGQTPLIISAGAKEGRDFYVAADRFAKSLNNSHYIHDPKTKTVVLSEAGVKAAEIYFHLPNLYDVSNTALVHHIGQALKANYIMQRDVDYMVDNGEIMLIDQNTGRKLPGRAFSEGLNQAIEAKEGVKIKQETVTIATVTFQNFFRLYRKLSGMTGTAKTEEEELTDIYNMRVVVIPTNKPIQRIDDNDSIFGSLDDKFNALIADLEVRHKKGQPVLIGTSSVEVSEHLSKLIRKRGIKHEVLNAKNNEREAEIVALAGQKGAVTIATNMAGRGTDIKLGEGVKELGGLAVLGSERNDSRRVDNQLRGRSGRQGDPGYSKFYVSIQDNLMKHFGDGRIDQMPILKNGLKNGECIESPLLNKVLSSAQLRVEGANYDHRKSLLRYDEVLRQQREIIYSKRDDILKTKDPKEIIRGFYKEAADYLINASLISIDGELAIDEKELEKHISGSLSVYVKFPDGVFDGYTLDETIERLADEFIVMLDTKYPEIDKEFLYNECKSKALRVLDNHWKDHIDAMDKFKNGVQYLGYAQQDPINVYANEGFRMFKEMNDTIAIEVTMITLNMRFNIVRINPADLEKFKQALEQQANKKDDQNA